MSKKPDPNMSLLDDGDKTGTKPRETLPAVIDESSPSHELAERSSALADLRDNAMSVPVVQMMGALEEYADRRTAFYRWLLSKMTEGVHYGVPPGCEPRGNVDPRQWKTKPSLYKAGADFVCDLMGLRDQYETDRTTWEVLGSPEGVFIRKCQLFSRNNGKLIGEGTGARTNGTKKMDINGSIKMADKTAKVAAIINSYGLSDLFTQDIEDLKLPEHEKPEQKKGAPQPTARDQRHSQPERVAQEELTRLIAEWKTQQSGTPGRDEFAAWCLSVSSGDWSPSRIYDWTRERADACWRAMGVSTE